jgi:predicted kinase
VSALLYGTLLSRAVTAALAAGLAVVVDATFLKRDQRQAFRRLAADAGAGFGILAFAVSRQEGLARIALRRERGGDPSEADGTVLARQFEELEPLSSTEQPWLVGVGDSRLSDLGQGLAVPL